MTSNYVSVKFYHKNIEASGNGSASTWSGHVQGNSESVVMERLNSMHKGKVITIREIKWRAS